MSKYSDCKGQAKKISVIIHNRLGNKPPKKKFFVEYPDVDKFKIKDPILLLGLNPSEGNAKLKDCGNLFLYIPQTDKQPKGLSTEIQSITYPRYFKTYIELFQKLNPPYNPSWYNSKVLEDICKKNRGDVSSNLKDYLNNFNGNNNGNYVLFADLIQYAQTNSSEITRWLNDEKNNKELIELINGYIRSLLDFIKPKLVLAANASISNFLVRQFNGGNKDCTYINIEGRTTVFLASMLTRGVMDSFSRKRLFNEMQAFIKL